jgi:hypothetical protein
MVESPLMERLVSMSMLMVLNKALNATNIKLEELMLSMSLKTRTEACGSLIRSATRLLP